MVTLRTVYKEVIDPLYYVLKEQVKEKNNFIPQKILDIGAWNGFFTRICKMIVWPNAHYTCIEAGKKHEKKLNDIAEQVHIEVLGDSNRDCIMYTNEIGYTKGASLFDKTDYADKRKMKTLETVVGKDATYDFIKSDVQGAELMIMKGSPAIFQRAQYVMLEVQLLQAEEIDTFMKGLGFNKSIIVPKKVYTEMDKIYWKG
jgi:FkbM family methyltransferase|tara:strand:+ start:856 stop:1458 length:603 start_codon:yes stop_codon:yes gene_type:complete